MISWRPYLLSTPSRPAMMGASRVGLDEHQALNLKYAALRRDPAWMQPAATFFRPVASATEPLPCDIKGDEIQARNIKA